MCRALFNILLIGFLSMCVQNVKSCNEYFSFIQDGGGVYGLITINYFGYVSTLVVRLNFTIGARLASSYTGSLQPIGAKMNLLSDFNRGKAMQYKVYFPVISPLPRVTSITVNDRVLCYGQGDVLGEVQYVTRITLQHKLFYEGGTDGIYNYYPQNTPAPSMPQYNNFEDENRFVIDNSIPEFEQPQPQPPTPAPQYVITNRPQTTKRPVLIPSRPIQNPFLTQVKPQSTSQCGINNNIEEPIAAPLIYNGVTYDPGEWPWLVAMYKLRFGNLNYICAGTLVSPTHVISAAHCVYRKSRYTQKKNVVIRAGIYSLEDWNDNIVTRSLKELHIHDNYNATTLENDILVMTLKKEVPYSNMIQPACLWSGNAILDEIVGKSGVVAGWGANEEGSGGTGIPRMVTMPVVSTDDCRASKSDFHRITSSKTLCAGDRSGSGPCLGDSGGGLYLRHRGRWRLRGIVSLALVSNGESQCDLNQYIVFTDTAQYLPWITDVMSIT